MNVVFKRYQMGTAHAKWECFSREFQSVDGYKIIFYDNETGTLISTNYLTASTMNCVDSIIEACFYHSDRFESLHDVYDYFKNSFYGSLFSIEEE